MGTFFYATDLTAEDGALDTATGFADDDGALTIDTDDSKAYMHRLESSSSAAEDSPNVIAPDSGTGRWLLQTVYYGSFAAETWDKYALFTRPETASTNGGTPVADTWTRIALDTEDNNGIDDGGDNVCSLDTVTNIGRVTLSSGDYEITAGFCAYGSTQIAGRIYDITNSETLIWSPNCRNHTTSDDGIVVRLKNRITIVDEIDFELQYYIGNAVTNYGLGRAYDNGAENIYAYLLIQTI